MSAGAMGLCHHLVVIVSVSSPVFKNKDPAASVHSGQLTTQLFSKIIKYKYKFIWKIENLGRFFT